VRNIHDNNDPMIFISFWSGGYDAVYSSATYMRRIKHVDTCWAWHMQQNFMSCCMPC